MTRVVFVTYGGAPAVAVDDVLAAAELERQGAWVEGVAWDDATARWESYDAVVVRSTWDYHLRPVEFAGWLDHLGRVGARAWNPPALLRWNADKRYLRDLAAAGVRTVPTHWVLRSARADLCAILQHERWSRAVVKPVVSASAHETWRTELPPSASDEARFRRLVERTDAMVQSFVESITHGEWSAVLHRGCVTATRC
jgi:glutathione synthase/RimK-type ligase-like ATP-grasp enzyme